MSFRINTNTQAAMSLSSLSKTSNEIGMRQQRLSSGSRINSAADDSAGFTISNKLTATTRGQAQALSNIGDAKSMMTVAEGALGTTMDILLTMKEKATQAGNDSFGTDERAAIQSQIDSLTSEVNDILSGAEFNGTSLFSDSESKTLSFQVGDKSGNAFGVTTEAMGVATLGIGTADASAGALEATDISSITFTGAGNGEAEYQIVENGTDFELQKSDGAGNFTTLEGYEDLEALQASGNVVVSDGDFSFEIADDAVLSDGASFSVSAKSVSASSSGDTANVTGLEFSGGAAETAEYQIIDGSAGDGSNLTLQKLQGDGTYADLVVDFDPTADELVTDGNFEFVIEAGASSIDDQFKVAGSPAEAAAVEIGNAGTNLTGGPVISSTLDLSTAAGAASAIDTIDAAIQKVNSQASRFGDVQNRLDFKAQNLETSKTNYEAANSRIADADFAKEQMEIVKLQILQQTGSAMFAQANASGQSVLSFF